MCVYKPNYKHMAGKVVSVYTNLVTYIQGWFGIIMHKAFIKDFKPSHGRKQSLMLSLSLSLLLPLNPAEYPGSSRWKEERQRQYGIGILFVNPKGD